MAHGTKKLYPAAIPGSAFMTRHRHCLGDDGPNPFRRIDKVAFGKVCIARCGSVAPVIERASDSG